MKAGLLRDALRDLPADAEVFGKLGDVIFEITGQKDTILRNAYGSVDSATTLLYLHKAGQKS